MLLSFTSDWDEIILRRIASTSCSLTSLKFHILKAMVHRAIAAALFANSLANDQCAIV
jgi:hypothetical protein